MEEIWNSLVTDGDRVDVPPWHREELDRRLDDPAERADVSWPEVQERRRRKP